MTGEKWSEEKIWNWYNGRPWLRGCNFMSSDCVNRIDQWQEKGFEERFATAERELKLVRDTGFNTIRIFPAFICWDLQHDGFMRRFDRYLALAWKYGISCTVVLGDDCVWPKDEYWEPEHLGVQRFDPGYHGARKFGTVRPESPVGAHSIDDPEVAGRYYLWVREMLETYKNDPRICIWDLYNEPGMCGRGEATMPHLKKFFEIAREVNPSQPVTSCMWNFRDNRALDAPEQFALDNSDIISYHNYGSYETNIRILRRLKRYDRPVINTEWLCRMQHNTVEQMFPLFYLEKVGCYNWGFVAGLYQSYEPWESVWRERENGGARNIDFKVWFHDLYRPNLRPYDPDEIGLIRRFCEMADEDFAGKQPRNADKDPTGESPAGV